MSRPLREVLDELDARIAKLEDAAEWQRQVGVMAACWPYTLPRPTARVPAQRRAPDPPRQVRSRTR